jgi:hypothetical protein
VTRLEPSARLVAFLLSFLCTTPARADLAIAAPSCADLDLAELERLVELELSDVSDAFEHESDPVVLLGCRPSGELRIEIRDPVTDKSVARTIVMPELEGRERALAIAIAQLFLTSWLELLLPEDEGDERDAPGVIAAERRAREAVAPSTAPPTPIERHPFELGLDLGARLHLGEDSLGAGLLAVHGWLDLGAGVLLGLRAAGELTRASRERGDVEIWAFALGGGAGYRTPEAGPFSLSSHVVLSALFVSMHGRASGDAIPGVKSGVAFEIAGELVPSLRFGRVRIGLPISIGAVLLAPEGEVAREAPVDLDGLHLSASLRASFAW